MAEEHEVWTAGAPDDGVIVLEGESLCYMTPLCYTMPLCYTISLPRGAG